MRAIYGYRMCLVQALVTLKQDLNLKTQNLLQLNPRVVYKSILMIIISFSTPQHSPSKMHSETWTHIY